MSVQEEHYDVIIVGGGIAGLSFAVMLGQIPSLRVALIESRSLSDLTEPNFDTRGIVLSYTSALIYQHLKIWDALSLHAEPIKTIHVSEKKRFGVTKIESSDYDVNALGYTVEIYYIQKALQEALKKYPNIFLKNPAEVLHFDAEKNEMRIREQEKEKTISCDLVCACDGERSSIREATGFEVQHKSYEQEAIVTNVSVSHAKKHTAFERFIPKGVLAFLPLIQNRYTVVWTAEKEKSESLKALSDNAFIQEIQQTFGTRLGSIQRMGLRKSYPLHLIIAPIFVKKRVALVGNSAHLLHPAAGLGFNVGLRDAAILAQEIRNKQQHFSENIEAILEAYQSTASEFQKSIIGFTDKLVKTFALPFLSPLRGMGLAFFDRIPLKHRLAKQAMGLTKNIPDLAFEEWR